MNAHQVQVKSLHSPANVFTLFHGCKGGGTPANEWISTPTKAGKTKAASYKNIHVNIVIGSAALFR